MGWIPVRISWRSSRGVQTRFGSRFGRGGGGAADVVVSGVASSFLWVDVLRLWEQIREIGPRLMGAHKHLSAGRIVQSGPDILNVFKICDSQ